MVDTQNRREPPLVLVKTWVDLIQSRESSPEVRSEVAQKMVNAFGTIKQAADYCARHGISLSR